MVVVGCALGACFRELGWGPLVVSKRRRRKVAGFTPTRLFPPGRGLIFRTPILSACFKSVSLFPIIFFRDILPFISPH